MGLGVLINPDEAEGHPKEMFLVGFAYSIISAGVATLVSSSYASMLMLFFTVIATLPIFFSVIGLEAKKDENLRLSEYRLLASHGKAVSFFVFLFFGFVAGYLVWFFLPFLGSDAFSIQAQTISEINPTGQFISEVRDVHHIFWGNFKLLMFSTILSVLFGAGVLFIIAWNASVIATAIGLFVNDLSGGPLSALHIVPSVVFRYLVHGTLEMVAYFIGGLVGGILFIELIRHKKKHIVHVATDVAALFFIATVLLYISAWIEVGVLSFF